MGLGAVIDLGLSLTCELFQEYASYPGFVTWCHVLWFFRNLPAALVFDSAMVVCQACAMCPGFVIMLWWCFRNVPNALLL